jgi:hypothetical protein
MEGCSSKRNAVRFSVRRPAVWLCTYQFMVFLLDELMRSKEPWSPGFPTSHLSETKDGHLRITIIQSLNRDSNPKQKKYQRMPPHIHAQLKLYTHFQLLALLVPRQKTDAQAPTDGNGPEMQAGQLSHIN